MTHAKWLALAVALCLPAALAAAGGEEEGSAAAGGAMAASPEVQAAIEVMDGVTVLHGATCARCLARAVRTLSRSLRVSVRIVSAMLPGVLEHTSFAVCSVLTGLARGWWR